MVLTRLTRFIFITEVYYLGLEGFCIKHKTKILKSNVKLENMYFFIQNDLLNHHGYKMMIKTYILHTKSN